jgi:AraC-like DNA-binding protein
MNNLMAQSAMGPSRLQFPPESLPPSQMRWMSLASESQYRPVKMAQLCRISLRHLEREFKIEFGCTPREWLKTQRLNNALLMLRKAQSVKQVAYELAYPQIAQFCREFKVRFGITPREFRQSQTVEQDNLFTVHLGGRQGIQPSASDNSGGNERLLARLAS